MVEGILKVDACQLLAVEPIAQPRTFCVADLISEIVAPAKA
jgi:hypothetical protein